RLAGLLHRWLIPLKPRVLVQGGARRIAQLLLVGDPLVVGGAGISPAEEQDAVVRGAGQHDVLVRMRLLLAAVVPGLFFGIFRPLPAPLGTVDDFGLAVGGRAGTARTPSAVGLRRCAQVEQVRAMNL